MPVLYTNCSSIWVIMNGLAQILSSLLMYGIGKTLSSHLAPWRVLFLICGALTAGFEVLFHFVVPSNPGTAWFLTQKEREVIVARMALDRDGGDQTDFSIAQVKESIMDMRAWLVFAFGILVTMQSPVLTVGTHLFIPCCLQRISNHGHLVRFLDHQELGLRQVPNYAIYLTLWSSADCGHLDRHLRLHFTPQ